MRAEAAAFMAVVGGGGRITGIAVGIDCACVGIHRSCGAGSGAVLTRRGRRGDCRSAGGGSGCRTAGTIAVASRAGHREQQNRGQKQGRETQSQCPMNVRGCFHCMTIPFGQGMFLCLVLRGTEPCPSPAGSVRRPPPRLCPEEESRQGRAPVPDRSETRSAVRPVHPPHRRCLSHGAVGIMLCP